MPSPLLVVDVVVVVVVVVVVAVLPAGSALWNGDLWLGASGPGIAGAMWSTTSMISGWGGMCPSPPSGSAAWHKWQRSQLELTSNKAGY